jgi:hypothetical protein
LQRSVCMLNEINPCCAHVKYEVSTCMAVYQCHVCCAWYFVVLHQHHTIMFLFKLHGDKVLLYIVSWKDVVKVILSEL